MKNSYDDIINLPRHVSKARPQMPTIKRAAQFAPFAALAGHDAAVKETARLTDERIELDEYMKSAINDKLQIIAERIKKHPQITVTYFQPDPKKSGGAYVTTTAKAKRIDKYARVITMIDDTVIPIAEIISIDLCSRPD